MSQRIGRRGVCILAWSVTLGIPGALIFAIGWPWLSQIKTLEQQIESLDTQIVRYQRLLQTLPGLQAELEQVKSNKDVADFYFDAKTPALAGAQLQREVQQMVTSSGGQVTSTQLLPSSEDVPPPKVRVRTQIQGNTNALLDVLYQIEKARPFLFVDQLTVRAPAQRRAIQRTSRARRRSVRQRSPRESQLTIRLDVFGYALGETP